MKSFKILIALSLIFNLVNSEIYSSTNELVKLMRNGKDLVENLKDLIEDLEHEVEMLKIKVESVESELSLMNKNPQDYVSNPLNAFILIKILSHDVEIIQSSLYETLNSFNDQTKLFKLPQDDLNGAIEGFVRLQKVYELKSEDISNGVIDGVKIRNELSAFQLFTLASEIMKIDRKIASEYFEISLKKSNEEFKIQILEKMVENYREMGKFSKVVEVIEEIIKIEGENEVWNNLKQNLSQLRDVPDINISNDLLGTHYTYPKYQKIFSQACMGKRVKSSSESSKLFCKFHSTNFFTKIAPLKLEIVNFLPFVGIFHDVISDNEIEVLKDLKSNLFMRATTLGKNATHEVSKERIAMFKFIFDFEHKVVDDLTKRTGDMTGLNMQTSEGLQVQNYGIGGHYNMHHDYSQKGEDFNTGTGNRIGTVLFYLSNVEKGGATVFPFLRLYVEPRKGSAVFWHNLSSSGHRESLTFHGACPVLIGSKWVANKWLHEFGQEHTRPCELHPMPTEEDNWPNLYYKL